MAPLLFAVGFLLSPSALFIPPTRNLALFLLRLHRFASSSFRRLRLELADLPSGWIATAVVVALWRRRDALLETKLLVEPLDELLRLQVHPAVGLRVFIPCRERRVGYPQLPYRFWALPEAPHRRGRRRRHDRRRLGVGHLRVQHFKLLVVRREVEVVRKEEGGIGRGVAAAELHLLGVVVGEVGVHVPRRAVFLSV
ncbi:hypothetical protein GW17_00026609 [Ensete ventricosum]|nr:hypothetical protein GW17_00026609 [Ensete ventricosum]